MGFAERVIDLALKPLQLEGGGVVEAPVARVWIAGPDVSPGPVEPAQIVRRGNEAPPAHARLTPGVPTILLVHALTGDHRAGGAGGWWEPLIGPGRPLDPTQVRLVCVNNLGSCYGSSGPGDTTWPRDARGPALITTWDQARFVLHALDALGVGTLELVAGGSLGGMIALAVAALEPARTRRLLAIAATAAASPWIIGWNHVARQILALQPEEGEIDHALAVARQLAMLTYRAEPGLEARHGRDRAAVTWAPDDAWSVGAWLDGHGERLRRRFLRDAYALQLGAMDHHDLTRAPSADSEGWSAARIRASTLVVSINTDALYLPAQSQRLHHELAAAGVHVDLAQITSPHGHDAFLMAWDQLTPLVARALALPTDDAPPPSPPPTEAPWPGA